MQPAFMEIILTQCKWAIGFPQPSHMFQLSPTEQLASLDNAFQVQMGETDSFFKRMLRWLHKGSTCFNLGIILQMVMAQNRGALGKLK